MPVPVVVLLLIVGVCLYFVIGAVVGGIACRVWKQDVRDIADSPCFILPCLFWPIFLVGVAIVYSIVCLVKYPAKAIMNIGEYVSKIGD